MTPSEELDKSHGGTAVNSRNEAFQLEIHVDGLNEPFIEISDEAPVHLPAVGDELDIELPSADCQPFDTKRFVVKERKFWMTGAFVYSVSLYVSEIVDGEMIEE